MIDNSEQLISAIRVKNLFGLYTYRLPQEGSFSNASILYGDNGVGKSTILRLAFHLLSAAGDRGHRTALYQTVFDEFEVDLSSGVTVSASRNEKDNPEFLTLEVSKNGEKLAIWNYRPKTEESEEGDISEQITIITADGQRKIVKRSSLSHQQQPSSVPRGEKAFLAALEEFMPTVFILHAERRLDSDSVPDPSDEVELRRALRYGEPKFNRDLVVRSREIALSQALSKARGWIARNAIQAANQGSVNVHSVYVNVLRYLLAPSERKIGITSDNDVDSLVQRLASIEQKTAEFARYELETKISTAEFQNALRRKRQKDKSEIVVNLLKPYIESSEGRLAALEPIYRLTDRFVRTLNTFLSDKSLSYTLSHGFNIHNRLANKLEPAQLSSGEQQLLLLFCYVLTGRDQPSVFMIDEPEISLNIKWQRQLVQSLLDITQDARVQFIFASHSMELLAQHRHRVIRLVNAS